MTSALKKLFRPTNPSRASRNQTPGLRTTLAGMLVQLQDAYGMSEAIDLAAGELGSIGFASQPAMVELW
jgi:hypothetical protein